MPAVDEDKQKLIASLFVAAGCIFGVGFVMAVLGFFPFGPAFLGFGATLMFIGALTAVAGLAVGILHNRGVASGPLRAPEEGRIVARFAINQIGEMIFDNIGYYAEEARYYVRVQYRNGRREELECARPVYDQCGEGMLGLLTVQGAWLAQFQQLVDSDQSRAAYREW